MHTHSTTNTHKTTTQTQDNYNNTHGQTKQLHTRQPDTSDNTCETNQNTTCTEGENTQVREYCVLVEVK